MIEFSINVVNCGWGCQGSSWLWGGSCRFWECKKAIKRIVQYTIEDRQRQMPHGGGHQYSTSDCCQEPYQSRFGRFSHERHSFIYRFRSTKKGHMYVGTFYYQLKRERHWNKVLVFLKLFVHGVMLGLPSRLKDLNFQ